LQFKGEMLQNMTGPGTFLDPLEKAARLTIAATMLIQTGKASRKALIESRDFV
jgi:hypothetical protein